MATSTWTEQDKKRWQEILKVNELKKEQARKFHGKTTVTEKEEKE